MDNEMYHRAVKWHEDYLKWAEKNNLNHTEDYIITRYALKCIRFRKEFDDLVHGRKGREQP